MVGIIDYGVGNLFSLKSSLAYLGIEASVVNSEKAVAKCDRIILPGVGAFGDADGYEESLYKTEGGKFFLYVNGGEESPYAKEDIKRMSAAKAEEWLAANA